MATPAGLCHCDSKGACARDVTNLDSFSRLSNDSRACVRLNWHGAVQDKEAVKQHRESLKRRKAAKLAQGDDGGGVSAQTRTNAWRGGMGAQKTMLGRRR
eukprot:COSAG02_NODE_3489_length_6660_cov_19.136707_3_plen_100_part_00